MRSRCLALVGALALVIVTGAVLAPVPLAGQRAATATSAAAGLRTPWGDPDLQGIWDGHTLTPLQRPRNFANKPVIAPAEEAKVVADVLSRAGRDARRANPKEDVAGAYNAIFQDRAERLNHGRTGLIVDPPDGRIPPMTPEAKARAERDLALRLAMRDGQRRTELAERYNLSKFNRADGPEDRSAGARCLGMNLPVLGGDAQRIVQSPGVVAIFYNIGQGGGFSRIIPIDGTPRLPSNIRQRFGDARGHWEGNTLVVDVTNFTDRTEYQGSRENLHLTERFTRTDANILTYEVTLEDPTTWTKPWTARILLDKKDEKANEVYQQTCHEGNYGLIGILSGHRAAEKAFAEGRGPDPFTLDSYTGGGTGPDGFATDGGGIELVKEE